MTHDPETYFAIFALYDDGWKLDCVVTNKDRASDEKRRIMIRGKYACVMVTTEWDQIDWAAAICINDGMSFRRNVETLFRVETF